MLEIRKSLFSRSYENSFFRQFSRHLYNVFKEKNLSGVLIGSPVCQYNESLQIDALLITTDVVCIIDFKNFKGKINLPEEHKFHNGFWINESGEKIKGGSSINPYMQLIKQKTKFVKVAQKHILGNLIHPNSFNPLHLIKIVCFQEEIELVGSIPSKDSLSFFIFDKSNFIEKILDIIDITNSETKLDEESFDSFKKIFRADKFKFDDNPYEDKLKDIASKSTNHDFSELKEDQRSVLTEIKSFLEDPEQRIFILQGTTNSGKSHLIPFIQEIAEDIGIKETEIFAATGKVAHNLLLQSDFENVHSIYSYIYDSTNIEGEENEELANDNNDETKEDEIKEDENKQDNIDGNIPEEIPLDIVPLGSSGNSENALYIVDESQLVSNSRYESIDLRFGSGYLLKDFLKFTNISETKRKIIFIGDPFQLHSGKFDVSSLNPEFYKENYDINPICKQITDKPEFSEITKESLKCVNGIRLNYFNSLSINPNENIVFLKNDDILESIKDQLSNNIDFHYLCFKNEDSQKVNYLIKETIINTGKDISKGDLIMINNNIKIENEKDPFSEPHKIYNGEFAIVESVSSEIRTETKIIDNELTKLNFREIEIKLNEYTEPVKILSLENYRTNPNPGLSENEVVLFKILLNTEVRKAAKKSPFIESDEFKVVSQNKVFKKFAEEDYDFVEQVIKGTSRKKNLPEEKQNFKNLISTAKKKFLSKVRSDFRKDPSSEYYKLINAAHIRFGWAMTVHKSTSFKWQEVIFNVSQNENSGKTNADYFRWLYTGITRAKGKLNLVNFTHITPYDKTIIKDDNNNVHPVDLFLISNNTDLKDRLEELKDFVDSKLLLSHIVIDKIEHLNYQERFILCKDNLKADISIYYDGHGKFKSPKFVKGDKEFGNSVIEILKEKSKEFDFSIIPDKWRKEEYENLSKILIESGIYFELIIQTNYKDRIRLFDYTNNNGLEIEVDYKGDGAFGKISAKYYSDIVIWEKFKNVAEKIKNKNHVI